MPYITSHYITLHHITSHYITLHYIRYITLHYVTLHPITLQYVRLQYITLHYTTLYYITLHNTTLHTYILQIAIWLCTIIFFVWFHHHEYTSILLVSGKSLIFTSPVVFRNTDIFHGEIPMCQWFSRVEQSHLWQMVECPPGFDQPCCSVPWTELSIFLKTLVAWN